MKTMAEKKTKQSAENICPLFTNMRVNAAKCLLQAVCSVIRGTSETQNKSASSFDQEMNVGYNLPFVRWTIIFAERL